MAALQKKRGVLCNGAAQGNLGCPKRLIVRYCKGGLCCQFTRARAIDKGMRNPFLLNSCLINQRVVCVLK